MVVAALLLSLTVERYWNHYVDRAQHCFPAGDLCQPFGKPAAEWFHTLELQEHNRADERSLVQGIAANSVKGVTPALAFRANQIFSALFI